MLHQEPTSSVYIANYFSLTWTSTYHPLLRSLSLSQAEGKDGAGGTQAAEPVEHLWSQLCWFLPLSRSWRRHEMMVLDEPWVIPSWCEDGLIVRAGMVWTWLINQITSCKWQHQTSHKSICRSSTSALSPAFPGAFFQAPQAPQAPHVPVVRSRVDTSPVGSATPLVKLKTLEDFLQEADEELHLSWTGENNIELSRGFLWGYPQVTGFNTQSWHKKRDDSRGDSLFWKAPYANLTFAMGNIW